MEFNFRASVLKLNIEQVYKMGNIFTKKCDCEAIYSQVSVSKEEWYAMNTDVEYCRPQTVCLDGNHIIFKSGDLKAYGMNACEHTHTHTHIDDLNIHEVPKQLHVCQYGHKDDTIVCSMSIDEYHVPIEISKIVLHRTINDMHNININVQIDDEYKQYSIPILLAIYKFMCKYFNPVGERRCKRLNAMKKMISDYVKTNIKVYTYALYLLGVTNGPFEKVSNMQYLQTVSEKWLHGKMKEYYGDIIPDYENVCTGNRTDMNKNMNTCISQGDQYDYLSIDWIKDECVHYLHEMGVDMVYLNILRSK